MNEAAMKPEYIFICYDDIIRTHTISVMKALLDMKNEYKDFIDYSLIEGKSQNDLMWLCNIRSSYNILEHLAIKPFDYSMSLMNICRNITNIYSNSSPMSIGLALPNMMTANFIKKIYVYGANTEYIKQDIATLCGDMDMTKLSIVDGEFNEVIKSIQDDITLYIVNDVDMVNIILNDAKSNLADILLAKYGYNYEYDKEKKEAVLRYKDLPRIAIEHGFRLTYFMPIRKDFIDT